MVIKILNTACKLSSSPVTTVTADGLKRRLEFEAGKKPKTQHKWNCYTVNKMLRLIVCDKNQLSFRFYIQNLPKV